MTSPGGATAAAVWVDVLPSVRNFGADLAKQVAGAGSNAGERIGDNMGKSTESGFRKHTAKIAAAGLAIGAAVGVAVTKAMNVEAANDKLAAQLGANEQRSAQLGKIAGSLYGQAYGDSLDTVNEAIRGVIQSGLVMEDASNARIESITAKVLDLSTAFGQDLAGTTQAVGQMMKTGLAPNADAALDVLTRGFQQGADRSGDLLDTMTEYGVQFQNFGLNAQTATGLLVQGMQAGARNSDLVADAIKEFSIRAVDGSKLTAEGFAAIGLNASDMAAKIAAGGPTASAALDLTLDRLRAMEDPVARDAAAVALFGTQAEDLAQSLFALDPSEAAKRLGHVTGAAERMGNTLNDNANTNLVAFQRQVTQAFVSVVGGRVLPIVNTVASMLATLFGPALSLVGSILGATVVPALAAFGSWVARNQAWLVPLAAGVAAFTVALNANAIATAAWSVVTRGASIAARGWALAQAALNAVLYANPLTLIIAALVGLVAAIVVAYQRSETFRAVVQAAWTGIKTVAMAAWTGFLKPALDGFMVGLRAVGSAASWLWSTVLSPVFGFIGQAAKVLAAVVLTVLITPVILAFRALAAVGTWLWNAALKPALHGIGAAATWLWRNAIQPAFNGIGAVIRFVWNNVIKPIFGLYVAYIRHVIIPLVMFLWNQVIRPAFNGIGAVIRFVWNSVIKPIWTALVAFIRNIIVPAARFLWLNVIQPAWNGIGNIIRGVWLNVIKPAWNALVGGLNWVRDRFRNIVDTIGRIWHGLRGLLARPVNFLINTVWNGGILRAWNTVRRWIPGLPEAKPLAPIRWAQGGIHEDHTAQVAKGGDWRVWAEPETGGEAYIPLAASKRARSEGILADVADRFGLGIVPKGDPELFADGGLWRRMWGVVSGQFPSARRTSDYRPGDPGYHGSGRAVDIAGPRSMDMPAMLRINRWLAGNFANSTQLIHTQPGAVNLLGGRSHTYGAGTRADHRDHVHWALEHAGMLGGKKGSAGGFWSWVGDRIRAVVKRITDPLLDRMAKPPPEWMSIPANLGHLFRDKALDFFLGQAGGGEAVPGRGPVVDQVRAVSQKFGWGGGRQWNALYELIRRESSWNPRAQNPVSSAYGLYQFLNSTWATVGGHKTSNPGLQAEFGNRYVRGRYGNPAAAVAFHDRNNWYDSGGYLRPGWNLAYNGTNRLEPVLNDQQWRTLAAAAHGEDGAGKTVEVMPGATVYVTDPVDVDLLSQRLGFAARSASF